MNKLGFYPFSEHNKMAVRLCQFTAIVLLLLLPISGHSQRVGVVLSGGGAKGVAHVGVLKALEEHGIPIDYIAGTSMGAIIGGMYASGLSPDSIEAIVTSGEFQSWALGTIDEEYNFYYKRLPPDPSWVSVKFSFDSVWQYQLPSSLISPAQMDFAGMQYLSAVNVVSRNNFDSLFVPFRCVAADIERKEQVIFRRGEIFPAIRASMTYPFVFRPIKVDGRLLFDGGIYNNFPVDVMEQDFNPDFIIGSAVTQNFPPPTEDNIRSHIENLLVFQTDYNISPERGVVIRPDLPRTSVTDFSNSESFIDIGYGAAMEVIEQIKENVRRQVSANEQNLKRAQFNSRKPPMIIDRIFIQGVNEAQMDYIYKLLYERKPTPIEQIKVEYFKVLAEDHIERIAPRVMYNRNTGYFDLYLDVTLDQKLILNFGGNISTGPQNITYLEAQYQHLGFQAYTGIVNAYVGRFYNSLKVMGRMAFPTALPFFLEGSYTLNNFNYFRTNTLYFQDRTPSYLRINQNFLDITAGVPALYTGKILLGATAGFLNHDYYQTNQFARTDTTDRTNFRFFSPYLLYERNTLNRKQYPSQGTFLSVRGRFVSGSEVHFPGSTSPQNNISRQKHDWWQLRAEYLNYFTSLNKFKLGFYSEMLLSNKRLFTNHTSSLLSAPRFDLVPETRTIYLPNYRANNFAVLGLQGIFSLSSFVDFRLEGYIFQPFREIISEDNGRPILGKAFQKRYGLVSASVVANTPLGPAAISLNFYDRYETPFSISFNFGYMIFNQGPLR